MSRCTSYLETKGLADRLEEFVAYWFAKDAVIDRERAGAGRRLAAAHRRALFAATNQEHHRVAYLRDQAGLGAHFDEIIYSAALGVCKPDRVFFTTAQARMGVTGGAGDPVRRRYRRQRRRRARLRLAGHALSRARDSLARALESWG